MVKPAPIPQRVVPGAGGDPEAAVTGLLKRLSAQTEQRTLEERFIGLKGELNRELHKFNLRLNAFEREQRELLKSVLDVLAASVAGADSGSPGAARNEGSPAPRREAGRAGRD